MPTTFKPLPEEAVRVERKKRSRTAAKKPADPLLPTDYTITKKLNTIKWAIVGAFVLSLASFAGSLFLFQALNGERTERKGIEAVQVELKSSTDALTDQVRQYRMIIDRLREQIASYVSERTQWKQELEQSQAEVETFQSKLETIEAQNRAIEAETERLRRDLAGTRQAVGAGVREVPAPQPGPAPAVQAPAAPPPPSVMTLNRKFNFVVINRGLRDGVKMGDKLNVQRGGKTVGAVEVEKLYESFAAATILEEKKNQEIQPGDSFVAAA